MFFNKVIRKILSNQPKDNLTLAGRYRIIRKLGEGGMGTVWLAEDQALGCRNVAVKTLSPTLFGNKIALEKLKEEAQISLQLSHPNLAAVRTFDMHHDQGFLVMDYVKGQTLSQYLAHHGSMDDIEAFEFFAPLASALEYAHSLGITHRDIKPSNIMLRENGSPILMDFGISSEVQDVIRRNVPVEGTIPYMSPEQLRGESPCQAHDIYSLAATAYECLTGHPPFYKGDIADQILHAEAPILKCKCVFCQRICFNISKDTICRSNSASQIANTEKRLQSFTRWTFTKARELVGQELLECKMAASRLEYVSEECVKELIHNNVSSIDLPFIGPGKHLKFAVSRDDLRSLHW